MTISFTAPLVGGGVNTMSQVDRSVMPAPDPATAAQVWNATYQAQNAAYAQQAARAQAQQQSQAAAQLQQVQLAQLQPQGAAAAQPMLAAAPGAQGAVGGEADGGGGAAAPTDVIGALQQAIAAVEQVLAALGGGAPSGTQADQGSTSGGGDGTAQGASGCGMAGCTMPGCGAHGPAGAATAATRGGGAQQAARSEAAGALSQADQQLAKKIDDEVLAGTGLAGKGSVIVEACRAYGVPVDFVLAIYRKEASFARPGTLADRNNNPGNLRFAQWQSEHGGTPNGGFTKYPSKDDGIRASIHLLSRGAYKQAIDNRDWGGVIRIYAPESENDTATYITQMDQWTAEYRSKLGIDERWLQS